MPAHLNNSPLFKNSSTPRGVRADEARKVLAAMARKLAFKPVRLAHVKQVAGFDVAYDGPHAEVAAVVMDCVSRRVLETKTFAGKVRFPYIPGLLSFREGPLILAAHRRLDHDVHVLMVEGHGVAHPLGCGLASYVGCALRKPTIGVAKGILWGEVGE
ncbi:MAG: endonuclease V, partial [Candidatus Bathyarchaeia archaeon]